VIEIRNSYARHALLWVWVMPLVAILTMPLLMPASSFKISQDEVQMFSVHLGQDVAKLNRRTDAIFTILFIETGVYRTVTDFLTVRGRPLQESSSKLAADVSSNYASAFFLLLYRAIWRLNGILSVSLGLVLGIGLPALLDGLMIRARKAYNFKMHNPVYFWGAGHTVVMLIGMTFFLPILPFELSLPILLGTLGLLFMVTWVTAANFQTGL
jgi:hypothetical protein